MDNASATTVTTKIEDGPRKAWYRRLNENKGLLLALVSMAQVRPTFLIVAAVTALDLHKPTDLDLSNFVPV